VGVDLSAKYLGDLVPERMEAVNIAPIVVRGTTEDWAKAPLFAELAP
jgi:hypothetical protein